MREKNFIEIERIVHSNLDRILKRGVLEVDGVKIRKEDKEYGWVIIAEYGNSQYVLNGW